MPRAALLDLFFERYKWDWEIYKQQPEWLIQELLQVITAEADALADIQALREGTPSERALAARTPDETMRQAAAAGLSVPWMRRREDN